MVDLSGGVDTVPAHGVLVGGVSKSVDGSRAVAYGASRDEGGTMGWRE